MASRVHGRKPENRTLRFSVLHQRKRREKSESIVLISYFRGHPWQNTHVGIFVLKDLQKLSQLLRPERVIIRGFNKGLFVRNVVSVLVVLDLDFDLVLEVSRRHHWPRNCLLIQHFLCFRLQTSRVHCLDLGKLRWVHCCSFFCELWSFFLVLERVRSECEYQISFGFRAEIPLVFWRFDIRHFPFSFSVNFDLVETCFLVNWLLRSGGCQRYTMWDRQ